MKKITLLTLFIASVFVLDAQTIMPCLHDLGVKVNEEKHPGYRQAVNDVFSTVKHSVSPRTGEIYKIPVVIHVVWNNADQNIPMSQIEDQMAELNRCYRRQNPDTVNMRSIFEDVAGDPGIEFELIEVVRVETAAEFVPSLTGLPDNVKVSADGGSDAYDTNSFLNIWVCDIKPLVFFGQESPVLGYAYPPANLPDWPADANAPSVELEGVVIDFEAFGTGLTFTIPQIGDLPIEGRTAVHEVGHYLGLRHISGDGLSGQLGIPDCDADDGVADTPNQGLQSQFVCDEMQNTCTDAVDDRPDMIENYMDYSSETCMNTFTNNQIEIMRGVLEGPRAGLLAGPSSVKDFAASNAVKVFPNPFNESVTINFEDEFQNGNYFLTDLLGKRILIGKVSGEQIELNLSNLTDGVYNFSIQTEEGNVVTKRLVKK